MRQVISRPRYLRGDLSPPGDKSITHRALMLNTIAGGEAKISGASLGEDVISTVRCLKQLGVVIEQRCSSGSFLVHSIGNQGLNEPSDVLNAGNSGTTMRILAGLLASQPFSSVMTGDDSLRSRPMDRVISPLRLMGATISGRKGGSFPPLAFSRGNLKDLEYSMPVASAQIKSSLLLAGLSAQKKTIVHQPAYSRDHTERMLQAMGGRLEVDGLTLTLFPGQISPMDVEVPGDISSAAFWLVAGVCHPDASLKLRKVGINPTRLGIVEVLRNMGGKVTLENESTEGGEPVADVLVESSNLQSVEVSGNQIPLIIDELPVLAVAACFARGDTVIRGAQELRLKETDRINSTVRELSRLGANIEEMPDGMIIRGTGLLKGGMCQSNGDHRMAMSLGVAGLLADEEVCIEGAEAAAISYPTFWREIESFQLMGEE